MLSNSFSVAFQKASLAQTHTEDARSGDRVYGLAQIPNASNVLNPGPQRPASATEVHPGTLTLHGYLVW